MGFLWQRAKKKSSSKNKTRFLRTALPKRREGRVVKKEDTQRSGTLVGVLFLWLLFLATLCYVLFFSVFFLVGVPEIRGTERISQTAFLASVENQLTGKYLGMFPKRNFFLIRPRALESFLRAEYPLLSSITVTRVFPDGLSLSVTEKERILLWCLKQFAETGEEMAASENSCFLIDETGRARDGKRALLEENTTVTLFITDMSARAVMEGERVLDPSYGDFVIHIHRLFEDQVGIAIGAEYTTVSRFANEVRAKTSEGWEVYFNTEIPLTASLNTLTLLLEKELLPEKRSRLSYVDLRTENRVYYALREESGVVESEVISDTPMPEQKTDEAKKKKE